ncbi:hypothetical protein B0H16DRAFT_1452769 [Mycena metata]|uniref:CxC2-like cysteine cluster KDZ transposase-associated domain-containing protein n=1 Tax=Mycena metata TaxID=1033252 RepID=A0AAD7JRU1_9AGAR|nr:hypothetical protein B0H16DRAFT_1452769 [Mycena metata]
MKDENMDVENSDSADEAMADLEGDDSDEESVDENVPSLTLSQIAADRDEGIHCDLCSKHLAPSPSTRAFRCLDCELSIQCETCCSGTHGAARSHILQEWDRGRGIWGETKPLASLMSSMAKICAACHLHLAGPNAMLPDSAVLCLDCAVPERKLLCSECCLTVHKTEPLHRIAVWRRGWRATTLATESLVYHLGHRGEECMWPIEPPTNMTVITLGGVQRVNVKFCGCGDSEFGELPAGVDGEWAQILGSGWYQSVYRHPRICASFPSLRRGAT